MSGHTSSIVLPHQPVDPSSQQDINRDVTTVHWNVRKGGREGETEREGGREREQRRVGEKEVQTQARPRVFKLLGLKGSFLRLRYQESRR